MDRPQLTVKEIRSHLSELLILPLAAVCVATSYGAMIGLSLAPSMPITGSLGLLVLSVATVSTSVLVSAFRLPILLHLFGLGLIGLITVIFSSSLAFFIVVTVTWLAALLLGSLCAAAVPVHKMQHADKLVRERLDELQLDREVYARLRTEWMLRQGWFRMVVLLVSAVASWGVGHGMGLTQIDPLRAIFLIRMVGMLLFSLLIFYGLLQLIGRKQQWEGEDSLHIDTKLTHHWPFTVLLAALACVVAGLLLPGDISPLYAIDWNHVMNEITVAVFGQEGFRFPRNAPPDVAMLIPPPIVPTGSGSGGVGLFATAPLIYTLAAVGIVVWVVWHAISLILDRDKQQSRGLGKLLRAVLRIPLTLALMLLEWLTRLGGNSMMRQPKARKPRRKSRAAVDPEAEPEEENLPHGVATIRRLFLLLLLWAHDQGSPRRAEQTVMEYATALSSQMPGVAQDISHVARVYQDVRYSGQAPSVSTLEQVRMCLGRIVGTEVS